MRRGAAITVPLLVLSLLSACIPRSTSDEEDEIAADAGEQDIGPPRDTRDVGPDTTDVADTMDTSEEQLGLYEAVDEMQASIEASPDHLPNRAEDLVEEGSPQEIFQFVRDNIALLPNDGHAMTDLTTHVRWGKRAALRAGRATAREKAEILADLLDRKGIETEIVGPWRGESLDRRKLEAMLWHDVDYTFQPDTDRASVEQWNEVFSPSQDQTGNVPLSNRENSSDTPLGPSRKDEVQTLVDRVTEVLPEDWADIEYTFADNPGLPLVRAQLPGGTRVLNPLYPDASFEDDYTTENLDAAPEASEPIEVDVSVSYATARAPNAWQTAVEGSWTAREIAGRQLRLDFLAQAQPKNIAVQKMGDIRVFTPALLADGPELSDDEAANLSEVGTPFRRDGTSLEYDNESGEVETGDGTVRVSSNPDERISKVESIEVEANPRRFPCVDLTVNALDENGKRINGLPSEAFEIEESDKTATPTMLSNVSSPPRLLVIVDTSSSVPGKFRNETTTNFLENLATSISGTSERAEYAVLNIN